jgi:hypothetical protein
MEQSPGVFATRRHHRSPGAAALPVAIAASALFAMPAQALLLTEGFESISSLPGKGWSFINNSQPLGITDFFQGTQTVFAAQAGPADSYLGVNFNNASDAGTISNWAITPQLTYQNGDLFSFFTRTVSPPTFADRLQVRFSDNGVSANVGSDAESVGDFDVLLLDINPALAAQGFPNDWTRYEVTLQGLSGPTSGRIAFRYFVTNGGPSGANSDYIGIDTLAIQAVPGPLPALGLAAAFGYSRRLKRRVTRGADGGQTGL